MEAGEILTKRGLLDARQLEQTRRAQEEGVSLVTKAVDLGFVREDEALRALGDEVGLDFIDLQETEVDLALLKNFPRRLIHRQALFPVRRENGSLVVATSDPFDLYPLDEVSAATGLSVIPVLAGREDIQRLIKAHLGVASETVGDLVAQKESTGDIELLDEIETDGSELSEMAQEASVIRLVNEILLEAIEVRASDVHLESQEHTLVIRYRIDGMLHPQPVPPEINHFQRRHHQPPEDHGPPEHRREAAAAGRPHQAEGSRARGRRPRVGDSDDSRRRDRDADSRQRLDGVRSAQIGMSEETYQTFSELIRLPHGIMLVTGPTGSGKTTTLYSSLLEIKSPQTKIITTEDPVEYQLEGINQIQVHPKIGLTFAHSLRSILRHDPDIVLVGEIRDLETAENAIQASLTGHLVFSTLHTNDAAGAYTRLVDMGVEPFLVASTVEAVMAQRLVRTLCDSCKQTYRPDQDDLPKDFPWSKLEEAGGQLHRPAGCRKCLHVGYRGRLGLFELLLTTEPIRQLAHDRASTWHIQNSARDEGMITLRQDGWNKAIAGVTSVDEILRVTKGDVQLKR